MTKSPHVRIVTATEAKNRFGAIIKSAYALDEHLIVEKSGIPVVAIIPMADYQQLVSQQATSDAVSERIATEQRRAQAGRELRELLAKIHAEMPDVPPDEEEEVERLIQHEVDAVRRARAKKGQRKPRSSLKHYKTSGTVK